MTLSLSIRLFNGEEPKATNAETTSKEFRFTSNGTRRKSSEKAMADQAAIDLCTFLYHRATETSSGGKLVLSILARENGLPQLGHGPLALIYRAAEDFARDGLIADESFEQFVFPVYLRTFDNVVESVSGNVYLSKRYVIESAELISQRCPLYSEFLLNRDLQRYSSRYSTFIRGFSEHSIRRYLFKKKKKQSALGIVIRWLTCITIGFVS